MARRALLDPRLDMGEVVVSKIEYRVVGFVCPSDVAKRDVSSRSPFFA